jgi:hypothetical protein
MVRRFDDRRGRNTMTMDHVMAVPRYRERSEEVYADRLPASNPVRRSARSARCQLYFKQKSQKSLFTNMAKSQRKRTWHKEYTSVKME